MTRRFWTEEDDEEEDKEKLTSKEDKGLGREIEDVMKETWCDTNKKYCP